MSWWGSSDNTESSPSASSSDFTSNEDFNAPQPMSSGGGGGIEQFSVALQQQLLVQQAVSLLTDKSFEKCILGKPSDNSLSGREVECIGSTVGKWLDTNEFMMGRLERKAEKQQGAGSMMN